MILKTKKANVIKDMAYIGVDCDYFVIIFYFLYNLYDLVLSFYNIL